MLFRSIPAPRRSTSGYRDYPLSVVTRLKFIGHAKHLGFTLEEIKELLALRVHPRANCAVVRHRAQVKITDIDSRMRSLRRMKKALAELTAACESETASTSDCPILTALDE